MLMRCTGCVGEMDEDFSEINGDVSLNETDGVVSTSEMVGDGWRCNDE